MEPFYDMHCHILPGIDDGASNEYDMMKLVRIAYNEGIRTIMTTPHYHPYRGSADVDTVMRVFGKSYSLIRHYFPDMEVYEGCEIYFQRDIVEKLKNGELLTLANSKYVLVEFSTDTECSYIRDAISEILFAGYFPVIAHIERYDNLMDDFELVEELVESGAYVQVNAGSIIGKSGTKAKKDIRKMMQKNLVHFVGTDAHDIKSRPPLMKKSVRYVEKKFGEDVAERIFKINPEMLIKNKII